MRDIKKQFDNVYSFDQDFTCLSINAMKEEVDKIFKLNYENS